MSVKRLKMCKGKLSFTNLGAATRTAQKYNQRVYECPVCFCFHCTSLENWQDEFVPIEKYKHVSLMLDQQLESNNKKIKGLQTAVQRLEGIIRQKNKTIATQNKILSDNNLLPNP